MIEEMLKLLKVDGACEFDRIENVVDRRHCFRGLLRLVGMLHRYSLR
jgi:hypothetical protein